MNWGQRQWIESLGLNQGKAGFLSRSPLARADSWLGIQVVLSNIAISKSKVDAWIADFCRLRKAVLPGQLYIAKHKQQAAVM